MGKLRTGKKSDLLQCLTQDNTPADAPDVDVMVLDGAVLVNILHPRKSKTFEEYAKLVFLPHIAAYAQSVKRVDIV